MTAPSKGWAPHPSSSPPRHQLTGGCTKNRPSVITTTSRSHFDVSSQPCSNSSRGLLPTSLLLLPKPLLLLGQLHHMLRQLVVCQVCCALHSSSNALAHRHPAPQPHCLVVLRRDSHNWTFRSTTRSTQVHRVLAKFWSPSGQEQQRVRRMQSTNTGPHLVFLRVASLAFRLFFSINCRRLRALEVSASASCGCAASTSACALAVRDPQNGQQPVEARPRRGSQTAPHPSRGPLPAARPLRQLSGCACSSSFGFSCTRLSYRPEAHGRLRGAQLCPGFQTCTLSGMFCRVLQQPQK